MAANAACIGAEHIAGDEVQAAVVVQIDVETPTRLSAKQKELLQAFRETETGDECPASQGFFGRISDDPVSGAA